jgi:hypothetical protein
MVLDFPEVVFVTNGSEVVVRASGLVVGGHYLERVKLWSVGRSDDGGRKESDEYTRAKGKQWKMLVWHTLLLVFPALLSNVAISYGGTFRVVGEFNTVSPSEIAVLLAEADVDLGRRR